MAAADVTFRQATLADTRAINEVGERAFDDLARRHGWSDTPIDDAGIERELEAQRSLYRHLAETADQFWVAERQERVVGVARSIVRGDLRELTELFVLPEAQGIGIGDELLRHAFPVKTSDFRCILSTPDLAALALSEGRTHDSLSELRLRATAAGRAARDQPQLRTAYGRRGDAARARPDRQ